MAILTLGGTAVASPSKINVVIEDVDKIDKNAAGMAVIDRLAVKRRIECEWKYLTNAAAATLLVAAAPVFYTVLYYDPYDNATKTITCYTLEKVVGTLRYVSTTPVGRDEIKITFREQ